MQTKNLMVLTLAFLLAQVVLLDKAQALTFTVDSTSDDPDDVPGDGICATASGDCTLRAALQEANAANDLDVIGFNIPGPGPHTIVPLSELPSTVTPWLTGPVVIDGYTQPGASENTNPIDQPINAVLKIVLDGSAIPATPTSNDPSGLRLFPGASGSTVRGLVIHSFEGSGIAVSGAGNVFEGNFIGTDDTGMIALGNGTGGTAQSTGIHLQGSNHRIGGIAPGARNLVSGNLMGGIHFNHSGQGTVLGNFVGTDLNGTVALGNGGIGVSILGLEGTGNTIGGTTKEARNVISGDSGHGIFIYSGASGNLVQGNYIGTDRTGLAAVGNNIGVRIEGGSGNIIGGTTAAERNIISGNFWGVLIAGSTGNLVQGNYIGMDVTGLAALPNNLGVNIANAPNNTIGGTAPGARNIISGNPNTGVGIKGADATGNLVQGNYIGTDVNGTVAFGNGNGVSIASAPGNLIGGTTVAARNVISGSLYGGVSIGTNPGIPGEATGNVVQGNFIGPDVNGADLNTIGRGVLLTLGSSGNTIGGTAPGAGNTIHFNDFNGVSAGVSFGGNATGNSILYNSIAANGRFGVQVGTATGNEILLNTIAANGSAGVYVEGGTGNAILSNSIFDNTGLGIDLWPHLGVTPNDPGDADTGGNNLQNIPLLTDAFTGGGTVTVVGTLNSAPSTDYLLEFFANTVADPSGHGEGETFIGSALVTTDMSGDAPFAVAFAASVPVGEFVSATATDPDDNTSEFSGVVTTTPPVILADTGGTVESPDGNVIIDIEPFDLAEDTAISVTETIPQDPDVDLLIGPSAGLGVAVAVYVLGPDGLVFNNSATITISADVTGLNQNQRDRLGLYQWDETALAFVPVAGSVCTLIEDPLGTFIKTCTAELAHFSIFAMIAPADSDDDGVSDLFGDEVDLCPFLPLVAATLAYEGEMLVPIDESGVAQVLLIGSLWDEDPAPLAGVPVSFLISGSDGVPVGDYEADTDSFGTALAISDGLVPDVYNVTLLSDALGCPVAIDEALLVVYDPNVPRATGGGFILPDVESTLPAEDAAALGLSPKANFGFIVHIDRNRAAAGSLEFQYKAAGINLKSQGMSWYTVSNVKAMFQGECTINGEGFYTFRVHATDGDLTGDQPDGFDVRIWDGTDTESDPFHRAKNDLAGGSIVIHKK